MKKEFNYTKEELVGKMLKYTNDRYIIEWINDKSDIAVRNIKDNILYDEYNYTDIEEAYISNGCEFIEPKVKEKVLSIDEIIERLEKGY